MIPYFPLELAILPGEKMQLHIFEIRYRQLVAETSKNQGTFGIPCIINRKISEFGTEVRINKIIRQYDNGESDIEVEGLRVFKLLTIRNPLPSKLYAGGEVDFMDPAGHQYDQKMLSLYVEYMQQEDVDYALKEPKTYYQVLSELPLALSQRLQMMQISNPQILGKSIRNLLKLLIVSRNAEKQSGGKFLLN
ncbi:MAG: LON peptidase substrate-binding domain-containing protein [Bacteroidota bacterium]|jgi:Lon protease-like protein